MSWVNGRQLTSASDGTSTYSYIYDAAGSRIMKNVGTVNHLYFYVNGMLLMEYRYNAMGDTTDVLQYFYDANGKPHAMAYNGTVYLYVTNLQGDIVALLGLDGTVSGYEYDPYGNVIASYGDIAAINPLRYRGYYFDNETGLYHLQSRYYDPVVGRFINADSYSSTGQGIIGHNQFAYCGNNPISRNDTEGHFWETALDVVSIGVSVVEVAVNPADPWAWAGLAGDLVDLIPFVTGIGEATRAIEMTVELADGAEDVIASARKSYNALKKLDGSSILTKATGSYEITYSNNYKYVGKGGFNRAITSAKKHADTNSVTVTSISWRSATSSKHAFIDEYARQVANKYNDGGKLYNKIWSPGRRKAADVLGLYD